MPFHRQIKPSQVKLYKLLILSLRSKLKKLDEQKTTLLEFLSGAADHPIAFPYAQYKLFADQFVLDLSKTC